MQGAARHHQAQKIKQREALLHKFHSLEGGQLPQGIMPRLFCEAKQHTVLPT